MSFIQLKKKISEIISLNKEDNELIETLFVPRLIEKDTSVIEDGKIAREAFFINSGYLKYFKVYHQVKN